MEISIPSKDVESPPSHLYSQCSLLVVLVPRLLHFTFSLYLMGNSCYYHLFQPLIYCRVKNETMSTMAPSQHVQEYLYLPSSSSLLCRRHRIRNYDASSSTETSSAPA